MNGYIPRQSLWYLIASISFIIMPHFQRAPIILPIVWLLACVWQLQFFRQRWALPSLTIKFALITLTIAGAWWRYPYILSLEFVTQLLIITLLLKLIEMKSHRDVLVVLYLGYFAVVTQLLFSQNILASVYVLIAITLLTACLISLHQSPHLSRWHAWVLSWKMTGVSVPLLMVAFIVFPRLEPFWSVPELSSTAKTGISDSMSPGSFRSLLASNELALRVEFDGKLPEKHRLYWRAIILDVFDGVQWTQSQLPSTVYREKLSDNEIVLPVSLMLSSDKKLTESDVNYRDDKSLLSYRITQEPHSNIWMFSLGKLQTSSMGIYNHNLGTLSAKLPQTERIQYQLSSRLPEFSSVLVKAIEKSKPSVQLLSFDTRLKNITLPEGFNPRSIKFAQQTRVKFSNDEAYANKLLTLIRRQPFFYSLSPPPTGRNSVDDFWFSTRIGLCQHYSQALTVLLRAVNIPARVVTGYQGGFLNPFDNYVMVRQKDAHAWVEAWFEGKGWVRLDPTFAISPDRVERSNDIWDGINNRFNAGASGWGSGYYALSYIRKLSLKWDQLNFSWQQKVLNFNNSAQLKLLESLLGSTSYLRIALFIALTFFGLALVFFAASTMMQWRYLKQNTSELQRLNLLFIKKLEKAWF